MSLRNDVDLDQNKDPDQQDDLDGSLWIRCLESGVFGWKLGPEQGPGPVEWLPDENSDKEAAKYIIVYIMLYLKEIL